MFARLEHFLLHSHPTSSFNLYFPFIFSLSPSPSPFLLSFLPPSHMYGMHALTSECSYVNTFIQVHVYVKASSVFFNHSLFNGVGSLSTLFTEIGFLAEPGAYLFSQCIQPACPGASLSVAPSPGITSRLPFLPHLVWILTFMQQAFYLLSHLPSPLFQFWFTLVYGYYY